MIMGVQGAPAGCDVSPGAGLTALTWTTSWPPPPRHPQALAERQLRLAYSAANGLVGYIGAAKPPVLLGDASGLSFKLAVLEELATSGDPGRLRAG